MARTARITSLKEALAQTTIGVVVIFNDDVGIVSDAIPANLAGVEIPRALSREWCTQQGLKDEAGSYVVLRSMSGPNVAFISLGSNTSEAQNFRLVGAGALRAAGEGSIAVLLATDELSDPAQVAQALVEGALISSYSFKNSVGDATLDVVPLGVPLPSVSVHDDITKGVERGVTIANAVNWAKFLIDSPAGFLPPKELARAIDERLEKDAHVKVDIWTESRIKEERLGGLLGVGQGSAQPTRLVYATYDPAPGTELPHVALVGKGVTFDSGGLSIKSGEGMMTMKTDMSGAAIVMSVLSMASRLTLKVKVTAIAPLTENLLGDRATKPGDVLTIRNGMTIEVLNTDAEGRLILADGLSLAVETNADTIIDVATLTGAQNVALGDEVGAMYASTDELASLLAAASARSGEALWRMPLVDSYESHIESDVADMKNIGKPPRAGSITAALLLRRFTNGRAWAHLDIAGPGRAEAARGYQTKGATAFTARTLVEYLTALAASTSV
ncbi:MAG TPA: leucyl aminopeptidase family protein [Acidimicrobiales bacterium]